MRLIPMSRRFRMLAMGLGVACLLLWGFAIAVEIGHPRDELAGLLATAAATLTVVAAILIGVHMRSEKEKTMLLRALVNANRPDAPVRKTLPLRLMA